MGMGPDNFRKAGKLTWLLRKYFRYLSGNPVRGGVPYHLWPLPSGDPPLERGCHLVLDPHTARCPTGTAPGKN
jgi:hypothetical protein